MICLGNPGYRCIVGSITLQLHSFGTKGECIGGGWSLLFIIFISTTSKPLMLCWLTGTDKGKPLMIGLVAGAAVLVLIIVAVVSFIIVKKR